MNCTLKIRILGCVQKNVNALLLNNSTPIFVVSKYNLFDFYRCLLFLKDVELYCVYNTLFFLTGKKDTDVALKNSVEQSQSENSNTGMRKINQQA